MEQVEVAVYASLVVLPLLLLSAAALRLRRGEVLPPGPIPLPIIGHLHLLGPRLHQSLDKLSHRYGPLMQVRIGSVRCVVAASPAVAREFLKTQEAVFSSRKHTMAIDIVTYESSFAFAPYGSYWKYIKKLCTYELLGARNLLHFQPIRNLEVASFLRILMRNALSGETFNLTEELFKLTSNVISHMMLSIRCSGTDGEADAARTLVREVTQIFGEFDVADIIWFCKNFDFQGIKKRSQDIQRRYDALLENIITVREKHRRIGGDSPPPANDFLDMFLDIMESGKAEVRFTREHLKALILDFLTAGTDTTAIIVEWAISEMMNNPTVLKKGQEEIAEVVGFERLLQESDAPNLPYLQAVIKEAFRLHPPIPMLARKSISDCVVSGYTIPANTLLFVNLWSMGRNPQIWDSPTAFRPERFLDASIDLKGQHFELLPFGTGRRGCPGMLLAIQEVTVVIGTMIQCFRWEVPGGSSVQLDMTERPGLTAPRAHDLICCVAPRIDASVVSGN